MPIFSNGCVTHLSCDIKYVYSNMGVEIWDMHTDVHTHMCTFLHSYMHTYPYPCMSGYLPKCIHICMHIHSYTLACLALYTWRLLHIWNRHRHSCLSFHKHASTHACWPHIYIHTHSCKGIYIHTTSMCVCMYSYIHACPHTRGIPYTALSSFSTAKTLACKCYGA